MSGFYKIVGTEVHYANTKLDDGFTPITRDEEGNISNPELLPIIEAEVAQQEQDQINQEALAYLASTDWYVIRLQETGTEIPSDILSEREACRERIING